MFATGTQLRQLRKRLRLSQARLAELTHVPQHALSAFELEKCDLRADYQRSVKSTLRDLRSHAQVIERKKRYRRHSYAEAPTSNQRARFARRSTKNTEYLDALRTLTAAKAKPFTGVSLFAGCGGFSLGFQSAGCDIRGFVEIDDALSAMYVMNFPSVRRLGSDITNIASGEIRQMRQSLGSIDVLIGGPPCQGFSLSGKRDVDDNRNYLFLDYMRFLKVLRPKVAVIENVRLLTSMKSKDGGLVQDDMICALRSHGYRARAFSVNACDYGVPQHRQRIFFLALRSDMRTELTFPAPEYGRSTSLFRKPVRTFADACSDLEYIESGQATNDPLHKAVKHPDHVIRWLWDVRQGASAHENKLPELRPPSGYNTTYKRQVWNEPAATVQTTFGMISGCRNVHPIATRSLTIREAARLQSFPDSYMFTGLVGTIRTAIGNAVPPLLARAIAEHVRTSILDLVEVTGL